MADTEAHSDVPPEQDPDLLFVQQEQGYRLTLRLAREQLDCVAQIELLASQAAQGEAPDEGEGDEGSEAAQAAPEPGNPDDPAVRLPTPPDLFWFLQQNNILHNIDYPAIYEFCAAPS